MNNETKALNHILGLDRTDEERRVDMLSTADKADRAYHLAIVNVKELLASGDANAAQAELNRAQVLAGQAESWRQRGLAIAV